MKKENLILILAAAAACFLLCLLFSSCTVTVIGKPVIHQEVSPYVERVMGEMADSCRVISIESKGEETKYVMLCKSGAKEFRHYVIKKSFDAN